MKRNHIILTVILLLLSLFSYIFVKVKLSNLRNEVYNHLEEQGYTNNDLNSVKAIFSKQPVFGVKVIFKDEPRVIYMYTRINGDIVQKYHTTISNYSYKHLEK